MQHASASGQGELELRYHRPGSDSGEGPPAEALAPLKRDAAKTPPTTDQQNRPLFSTRSPERQFGQQAACRIDTRPEAIDRTHAGQRQ